MAGAERFRHVRILHRHLEERHLVRLRIQDRNVVGRVFGRAVQRAVGVDGRIAPVRRDQVVQIMLLGAPFPGGDDDVALDALGPRRLGLRQFALGDAVGPVAEILVRHAAELSGNPVRHHLARLTRLEAAHPGIPARLERTELRRDRAGGLLAELMAADAVDVVHLPQPVGLGDVLGNVGRAAEIARRRNLQHRVPVDRRIIVRRGRRVRRRHRRVVEHLPGLRAQLGRIHQPVAAHPDAVVRRRQVGDEVAATVVGDDDPGELGGQLGGFGDHPDAGFRPFRTGNDARNIGAADLDRRGRTGRDCGRRKNQRRCNGDSSHARQQGTSSFHEILPVWIRRTAGLQPALLFLPGLKSTFGQTS